MKKNGIIQSLALPFAVVACLILLWTIVWRSGIFHESAFPAPLAVLRAFRDEVVSGRLFTDLITSMFRVTCGFALAVATGIPAGLWLGQGFLAEKSISTDRKFLSQPLSLGVDSIRNSVVWRRGCFSDFSNLSLCLFPYGACHHVCRCQCSNDLFKGRQEISEWESLRSSRMSHCRQ